MRIVLKPHYDQQCCVPPLAYFNLAIALGLLMFCPMAAAEKGDNSSLQPATATPEPVYAHIRYAKTELVDGVYLLSSRAGVELPGSPELALKSGLPLVFVLNIEIERERNWWFNEVIASVNVRFRLAYIELPRRYQVTNLSSGTRTTHSALNSALRKIASMNRFPLIEMRYIEADENYTGILLLSLDTEALPLPLRPQAYLSPEWHVESEEFRWDIQ